MAKDLIYYYDKQSGISGPLCNRPNCLHNNENCQAYVYWTAAYTFSYYNHRLYWIGREPGSSKDSLISMAEDGTDRREEITFENFYFLENQPQCMTLHRGYMYWQCEQNSLGTDGKPRTVAKIIAFDLSKREKEGTVLFESEGTCNCTTQMNILGNRLYLAIDYYGNGVKSYLELYGIDTGTRECELLFRAEDKGMLTGFCARSHEEFYVATMENLWKIANGDGEIIDLHCRPYYCVYPYVIAIDRELNAIVAYSLEEQCFWTIPGWERMTFEGVTDDRLCFSCNTKADDPGNTARRFFLYDPDTKEEMNLFPANNR